MNAYLITDGKKQYVTDADDLLTAENKFFEQYDVSNPDEVIVKQLDTIEKVQEDESVIFF